MVEIVQAYFDHLLALADHYFHSVPKPVDGQNKTEQFRIALGEANFAYRTVMNIANATKHFARKKNGLAFHAIPSSNIKIGNFNFGWPYNGKYIIVDTT